MTNHTDVIIVGAGLSGIGAAYHLERESPGTHYCILEGRDAIGGTWDLFRYPGIRSDSDMFTLGYNFKPWRGGQVLADGPSIRRYIQEAADDAGIRKNIRFGLNVESASWDSNSSKWWVTTRRKSDGEKLKFSCNFLYLCAGYYSYKTGYTPEFSGMEAFDGQVIHPQHWPEDCDYKDKKVVIIGSGATAVTLVPAMAGETKSLVMLQRSPTYMISRPAYDFFGRVTGKILPKKAAYALTRWKNFQKQWLFYKATRYVPSLVKIWLLGLARLKLPRGYDIKKHFTPHYKPWDQRVCAIPDNDLYRVISDGKAQVVTDEIERFTRDGIELKSGEFLDADIIVTATGLQLVANGEIEFEVDGKPVNFAETLTYKGMMFSGIPNLVNVFGYINASWTLRADLISGFVCRLINQMNANGMRQVTPTLRPGDHDMETKPFISDFSAGYIERFSDQLPRQGNKEPWVNCQDYNAERRTIGRARLDDDVLVFSNPHQQSNSAVVRQ